VDDEVELAALQQHLQLLRPEGFLGELIEGGGLVVVASSGQGVDFEMVVWPGTLEEAHNFVGLYTREEAATGADVEGLGLRGGMRGG